MSPLNSTLSKLPQSLQNIEGYLRFLKQRMQNYDARFYRLDQISKTGINYRGSNVRYGLLGGASALGFLSLPWQLFWGFYKLTRMKHEQHFSEHMQVLSNFQYSSDPNVFALNVEIAQQEIWERVIYGVKLSKAENLEQQRLEQQQRAALIRKFCRIVHNASGRDFTPQEKQALFQLANAIEEKDNLFASVPDWDIDDATKNALYAGVKPILDKFSDSGINDQGQATGQGYVCTQEEREELLAMKDKLNNISGCIHKATPEQLYNINRLEHQIAKRSLIYDYQYAIARSAYMLNLQSRKWRLNARTRIADNFRKLGRNAFGIGLPLTAFMVSGYGLLGMLGGAFLALPLAAAYTVFQHWGAKRYPGHKLFYRTADDKINYINSQTAAAKAFSGDLEAAGKDAVKAGERLTNAVRNREFLLEPQEIKRNNGMAHLIAISNESRLSRKMIFGVNTDLIAKLNRLGMMMGSENWKRFLPFGGPFSKPGPHIKITQMSGELLGVRQPDYIR